MHPTVTGATRQALIVTRNMKVPGREEATMSKTSVAMRVCCDCYDVDEERSMYRCAKCGRFMCAECNCSCEAPRKERAGKMSGDAGSIAARVSKAIKRLFSHGKVV